MLARLASSRSALQRGDGIIHRHQHGLPWPERIQSAGLDEALEDALIQETGLDALAEIVQRLENALAAARITNGPGSVLAHIFDRGEAEADGLPDGSKVQVALVHIRSEEHTSELQSLAYLVCR